MAQMIADIGIDWAPFREAIAARMSNGRYTVINDNGFAGRYTASPKILFATGVLKSMPDKTKAAMSDPGVWTAPDQEIKSAYANGKTIFSNPGSPQLGPGSLEGFLSDTALQEKVFLQVMHYIYSVFKKDGLFTDQSTKSDIAGWLATTLLAGGTGDTSVLPGYKYDTGPISSADLQKCTSGPMGNRMVGLFAWWKRAGNDPTQAPGLDPLGKNSYSYFLIGSQSQPAGQIKTTPR
jgi:hypothetical protein